MHLAWAKSTAVWTLPIVIGIVAVMILSAGASALGASTSHGGAISGVAPSSGAPLSSAPAKDSAPLSPVSGPSGLLTQVRSSPTLLAQSKATNSWINTLLGDGGAQAAHPLASYPNLYYLTHPNTGSVAQSFPAYMGQPAPIGLSDLGLGATPYTYYTPHFLGQVTFNSPPNVTQPGSEPVIAPGLEHLGKVGSYYEFGIQLNTMLTNVSLPGTSDGVLWTQNVLNVNDTSIHWVDDVFNFSAASNAQFGRYPYQENPSILSGCGLTDVSNILQVYGGVYQCVGPNLPISAANYPLTISLYNNVSVNLQDNDVLTFGYVITGAGGLHVSGLSDTLVFNNDGYYDPLTPPDFTVDGTATTPEFGLPIDAELDLVGGIGGDNAVFRSLSGSLNLEYSNLTAGGWQNVPSAYDFGADTGETSTGIAGYWTGHTEYVNQGPTFLYGLWNGLPTGSVASGSIHLSGSITPSYGFVFVSNVAPDAFGTNFTWLPTNASGAFNTYLPSAIPPATSYYVQAFADEHAEFNGTFTGTTTGYTITLSSAAKTLNAPLYMWGNAQAAALGAAVTGAAAPPYTFKNLVVNLNFTFNHLNDFGYPSFEIFSVEGVSTAVVVNHLTQGNTGSGTDAGTGNYYIYDFAPPTGFLEPGPALIGPEPGYSSQVQILASSSATVINQTAYETAIFVPSIDRDVFQNGGTVFLWADNGIVVTDLTATDDTYAGAFVGDSNGTVVSNTIAEYDANGVDDFGSKGTTVTNLSASYYAFGVYDLGPFDATYSWINSTYGAVGVFAGGVVFGYSGVLGYYSQNGISNSKLSDLNESLDATGFELLDSTGNTLTTVSAYYYGEAGLIAFSNGTIVTGFSANLDAFGVAVEDAVNSATTLMTGVAANDSAASGVSDSSGVTISAVSAWHDAAGVEVEFASGVTVTGTSASQVAIGVAVLGSTGISVTSTKATDQAIGVELDGSTSASVTNTTASDLAVGVLAEDTTQTLITGVTASNMTETPLYSIYWEYLFGVPLAAVDSIENTALSATGITATDYGAAFYDYEDNGISLTDTNATTSQFAVVSNETANSLFSGIGAYKDWQGLQINYCEDEYEVECENTVTDSSFVDDTSYGVVIGYDSEYNTVFNNEFIGDNGATNTYNAAHIQAWSYAYNDFYVCSNYECTAGLGNYWADWHTYGSNGYLAPYLVTGDVWDYFPIGPQETFTVTFTESGLSKGTNWSVTFNGVTKNSTTSTITFTATLGTYSYTLNGVQGYQLVSGSTGVVTLSGAPAAIAVVYTSTQALATQSTVNGFFAIALAIGLIALVLALIAFLMHRRKQSGGGPPSNPPQAWTPPSGASGAPAGAGGAPPGGASGSTWSEGSGGGSSGTPPSGSS